MQNGADSLLHEVFEERAKIFSRQVAVVCGNRRLSYLEFDQRANRLARHLRRSGVRRGQSVGLLLPRSADVYVGLLGILKSGAAYVPIDPDYPPDRVAFILFDCGARLLVTTSALAPQARGFAGRVVLLDVHRDEIESEAPEQLRRDETGMTPEDICYIIYTSGTTGQPKGVQIEHRSAVHLVRTEATLFEVKPEDRVFQGFSIAFDASVEEVWLAFFAGATLVVGTQEMMHSGPELSRMLSEAGVTVLSTVPTLLAMMEEDVPSMRLLILGGESCPQDLIKRWWKPGRQVFNTYGPTEATVIATCAECHPHRALTIGAPLPGYVAQVLDENLRPTQAGVPGELCLGGIGLARGYVGQTELTREKFIDWTWNGEAATRLYRTGDLVRWTPNGELEFLGRIDTQVKIRGFRVELSEIESAVMEFSGAKAAAANLIRDGQGVQQLVCYLVPRTAVEIDLETLRAMLRSRLPAYMVPAFFEVLSQLPTLASGKVDRSRLPAPSAQPGSSRPIVPARNDLEKQIAAVWERLFAPRKISMQDDFFVELGGHSLLAARMVSHLRQSASFAQLSMLDVYGHPTIEALAKEMQRRGSKPAERGVSDAVRPSEFQPIPFWRHFFCGAAQCVSLIFILSFFALQWLAPYLTYTVLIEEEYSFVEAILGAFASLLVLYPLMLAIPIILKWTVIGRYRSGAYPLWGAYYFRWWLVTTVEAAVPVGYMTGTPLLNIYLRLMGAKIGSNVHLDSDSFATYDLLTIGNDSSVNSDSNLLGYTVEDGLLKIGSITIGSGCFVGTRASVSLNTVIEDDAALEDLSLLPEGATIPRGQTWLGSPAQQANGAASERPQLAEHSDLKSGRPGARPSRRFMFGLLQGLGLLIFPVLVVSALFPGIVVMNKLNYLDPYYWYLLLAPLVGVSFIVLLGLEIAAVKWLLLGKVKPGRHPLQGFYYLRKWFFDKTMDLSLDVMGPLYASVYLTPWYRLLGAKLGRGAEVSTASSISPDLLSIGDESFVADSVSLGAPRIRDGYMRTGVNHIGRRSFIGNSAMLPPDTIVGDNVLIGCLSAPPENRVDALREDTTWMGSPAIFLPERQKSADFPLETTFDPPARLRVQRAIIEFVRVILPSTCFIILLSLLFSALLLLRDEFSLFQTLLFFPVLYVGCGLVAAVASICVKWALVWRYRPSEKPLWCTFVWRNELINAMHEHLAEPFLIGALSGTPFVCWYFRLLGARIGRRVYMETTDFSEFDLATIGDEAALNADCTMQTHLFEDRVMKLSTVEIGPHCKVGAGSLVLYDAIMERGASLGDLSLLMKGETLPAETKWEGIPARPASTSFSSS